MAQMAVYSNTFLWVLFICVLSLIWYFVTVPSYSDGTLKASQMQENTEMPRSFGSEIPKDGTDSQVSNNNDSNTMKYEIPKVPSAASRTIAHPRNILLMISDDMRTNLGCYQSSEASFNVPKLHTPNLDKFASRSLLLKNAFVQYALCGPSRTSFLTSRRPEASGVMGNSNYWRKKSYNYTTLPQHLKNKGYFTAGVGKVFHEGKGSGNQDPQSWTIPVLDPGKNDAYFLQTHNSSRWTPVSEEEYEKAPLADMMSVNHTKNYLRQLADNKQPFFLAVGFKKPHASQVCPERFFKLYENFTEQHLTSEEMNTNSIDAETWHLYFKAYLACISYVDDLVGQVLQELEDTGLAESTVVVFMADHGYLYGEHGCMGKSVLFDLAQRVPLMLHVPGVTDRGIVSTSIVELVDIFPTLLEAIGMHPVPQCEGKSKTVELCTHGTSFLPLVNKPDDEIKGRAFSLKGRNGRYCISVRLPDYRLNRWINFSNDSRLVWSPDAVIELFDYTTKEKEYESRAYDLSYNATLELLSNMVHTHFSKFMI